VTKPVVTLAVALALAAAARAGTPDVGVLVPEVSLGGVRLGWTTAQVEAAWGRAEGHCRNCRHETLYFNRYAFRPQGAGVELVGGRVAAVFTLWAPPGWRTAQGLRIGEPLVRLEATYPTALAMPCKSYDAWVLPGGHAKSVVYVADGTVWGFALLSPRHRVCF
jgi:hypothetical protein